MSKGEGALGKALAQLQEESDINIFIAHCEPPPGHTAVPRIELLFARFKEDSADTEALSEFLVTQIVNYVVPLKKRREVAAAAYTAKGGADFSGLERLGKEARRKFIEFDKRHPGRASEIGELLAYLIAMQWLGAFQVASKMALKTSFNMPVHGVDGIHAKFESGVMTLFFLESKLAESASAGIADFCKSISEFASKRKQYLLEYSIISDLSNLESLADADRQLALDYFDVYGSKKSHRLERSVGVVCYPEKLFEKKLGKSDALPPSAHEAHFSSLYEKKREGLRDVLKNNLNSNSVDESDCSVWLVAVPDKNKLRELFSQGAKA